MGRVAPEAPECLNLSVYFLILKRPKVKITYKDVFKILQLNFEIPSRPATFFIFLIFTMGDNLF